MKWFQCQKQCEKHLAKKEHHAEGKKKLHSSVWGQCTSMMKNELEAMEGHEKMNKEKDPIKLSSVIKGVWHNFRGQKCPMASTWHAHRQLHNCIQREDEDTEQFHERFKNQIEAIEGHSGELGTHASSSSVTKNSWHCLTETRNVMIKRNGKRTHERQIFSMHIHSKW